MMMSLFNQFNRFSRAIRTIKNAGPIALLLGIVGAGGAASWGTSFLLSAAGIITGTLLGIPIVDIVVAGIGLVCATAACRHFCNKQEKEQRSALELLVLQTEVYVLQEKHHKPANVASVIQETPEDIPTDVENFTQFTAVLRENINAYRTISNELTASDPARALVVKKLLVLMTALPLLNIPVKTKLQWLTSELDKAIATVQALESKKFFASVRSSDLLLHLKKARDTSTRMTEPIVLNAEDDAVIQRLYQRIGVN